MSKTPKTSLTNTTGASSRRDAGRVPASVIAGINAALREQYRRYEAEPLPQVLLELTQRLDAGPDQDGNRD